jgi:uncharacterized protein
MIQRDYSDYFTSNVSFNAVLHNRNSVKEIYEFIYMRYNKVPRIAELNMRNVCSENKDMIEMLFHSKWKSETEFEMEESDLSPIMHNKLLKYRELVDFLKYYSINESTPKSL